MRANSTEIISNGQQSMCINKSTHPRFLPTCPLLEFRMLLAMKAINTPTTSYCPPCHIQCSSFLTISCARLSSVQNFFPFKHFILVFFCFTKKLQNLWFLNVLVNLYYREDRLVAPKILRLACQSFPPPLFAIAHRAERYHTRSIFKRNKNQPKETFPPYKI